MLENYIPCYLSYEVYSGSVLGIFSFYVDVVKCVALTTYTMH